MTKVPSTTTALVEEEFDGDCIQNAREVIAGTELQNAIAAVYGQKELLAASQQVHASTEKVETVDATAEWTDDKAGRRNRRCRRRSSKAAHCG